MLQSILTESFSSGSVGALEAAAILVAAFILSLVAAVTYRATHRGLSYSQSFTVSLILIGVLVSGIMMVIGSNIALALGAFGTLSLIRFRSAIKDPKDIAFILLVVAIGMSTGSRNFGIALAVTVVASLIIYILAKTNFGSIRRYDYILNFTAQSGLFSNDQLKALFDRHLKYSSLLNVSSREGGKTLDYTFNIKFITDQDNARLVEAIGVLSGVSNVQILSSQNDIEY